MGIIPKVKLINISKQISYFTYVILLSSMFINRKSAMNMFSKSIISLFKSIIFFLSLIKVNTVKNFT